ncbi:MAG TPA: hypothetical protein VGK96_11210, partial [Candidatus Sulfotelmatobacter sp.]
QAYKSTCPRGHCRLQRLPLVPIDRHRNQDDCNDPKNYVFATAFFLGHRRQYNTSEIPVQVPSELSSSPYGFAAASIPVRL